VIDGARRGGDVALHPWSDGARPVSIEVTQGAVHAAGDDASTKSTAPSAQAARRGMVGGAPSRPRTASARSVSSTSTTTLGSAARERVPSTRRPDAS
jgi:hypothetical protein